MVNIVSPLATLSTGAPHAAKALADSNSSGSGSDSNSGSSTATNGAAQVNEQQFLQLLVAQLKNQDPVSPMDGSQFVSQLAQFSELEQMIGVNQGVQQLVANQNGGQNSGSGSGSGSGTTTP